LSLMTQNEANPTSFCIAEPRDLGK